MTAEKINPPVNEVSRKLIEEAVSYSNFMFSKNGTLLPCIFFTQQGRSGHIMIPEIFPETKAFAAQTVHELRKTCDCVIFVSEFWITEKKLPKGATPESIQKMVEQDELPEQGGRRREVVGLTVHVPSRCLFITARINRNPTASLDEFETDTDTANNATMMGRFVA